MRRAAAAAAGRLATALATASAAEPACSAAGLAARRASGAAAGSRAWRTAGRAQALTSLPSPAATPPLSDLATITARPSPARLPAARTTTSLRGYAADAAAADDANGRPPPSPTRRVASPPPPPPSLPRPVGLRPPRTRGGGADGGAGAHAATAWRSRGGAGGPLAFLAKNGSARPKRPQASAGGGGGGSVARPGRPYGATSALLEDDDDAFDGDNERRTPASDGEAGAAAWDHEAADVGPVFPFSARAFYVGRRAEGCLARLRAAAAAEGLETVWDEPSSVMFRLGPAEGGAAVQAELQAAAAVHGGGGGEDGGGGSTNEGDPPSSPTLSVSDQYVAVFAPMGSVVFFNTPGGGGDAEAALWARLTAGGRLTCGGGNTTHADDVRLLVAPGLASPTHVAGDALVLRHPGTAVIKTVACVAAQTVALHFYEAQVDADLEQFRGANVSMAASGDFKAGTSKEALLKSVARNNVLMATIMGGGAGAAADTGVAAGGGGKKRGKAGGVSGGGVGGVAADALQPPPPPPSTTTPPRGDAIGIMSRLDVAWHDPTCAAVYDHLRDDLEIDARLAALGAKLTFVQDNLKYFLEIMQNKKSDTLEWTIIVLIAAEICVSLYDLFFKGVGGG
jgi:hypothetical protein